MPPKSPESKEKNRKKEQTTVPVTVANVRCAFGKKQVLHDISFSLKRGEIVCLLGLNGAGKTTTMRILSGLLVPGHGKVRVLGFDPAESPSSVRKVLGVLPEENILNNELTVYEHLRFAGKLAGYKKDLDARIHELAAVFALEDVLHSLAGILSKGYRQRASLAIALLTDPPVVILDEPSSGLDPEQQSAFHDLLRSISADKTLLLSTHLLPDVKALADRVLVIAGGHLIYDGPHPGDDLLRKALLGESINTEAAPLEDNHESV
ncbi:ABC transporter ATP-binding protein [Myxococcota bacterium]|nr:ABC transporter ATP-binding protein [Myxococcota bacterium]MBU1535390.1 ABC transporter ATP-binding protein [Myxococcota bacterium]